MNITITSFIAEGPQYKGVLELPDGSSVRDMLGALHLLEHLSMEGYTFVVLKNRREASLRDTLSEGDEILLLQSMAGG